MTPFLTEMGIDAGDLDGGRIFEYISKVLFLTVYVLKNVT